MKLGFFASHNGSNMQAIIAACRAHRIAAEPVLVISNNPESGALQYARESGIPAYHLSRVTHPEAAALEQASLRVLDEHGVDLVILAGFMRKLGPGLVRTYQHRIVNIHPSLLPAYGGRGMYGKKVHQAVLAAGERETGATVHLVDKDYDTGPVLAQCRVKIRPGDTIKHLAARVQRQEHRLYVSTVAGIVAGEIVLPVD